MYLFLDTTHKIQIGLLNQEFDWIEYQEIESKKSSEKLHFLIDDLLIRYERKIEDIESLIYCAGPGSYTGMRVAEGLINIFDWQGFNFFSFYHFQVPNICGVKQGTWYAKAFKGEYFLYTWNGDEKYTKLQKECDFELKDVISYYSHEESDVVKSTTKLIKENPKAIFKRIIEENRKEELYYYRPLEQEFTRSK